jgi:carbon starvation protein CstA
MRIFTVLLMVLVGAVFTSQPAALITSNISLPTLEGTAICTMSWETIIVFSIITIYYMLATMLPIDKIIGRMYPLF